LIILQWKKKMEEKTILNLAFTIGHFKFLNDKCRMPMLNLK